MIIPAPRNIKTITDLRKHPVELLKEVDEKDGPRYIFYRSTPKAVLLNLESYQKLIDLAEDYLDGLTAKEYENENKKGVGWTTLNNLKKKIGLVN